RASALAPGAFRRSRTSWFCENSRFMATLPETLPASGVPASPSDPAMYELLKTIDDPAQLRSLERRQLQQLADELRAYVLESVSKTGGHLSSKLGTVELTLPLH